MVTDDFLRSLLERPELAPVAESCAAERGAARARCWSNRARRSMRRGWPASPMRTPAPTTRCGCAFASRLLARPTLEASYLAAVPRRGVDVPPVLVHQLTQVLLRQVLGDERHADPGPRRRDAVPHPAHRDPGRRPGDGGRRGDGGAPGHAASFGTLGDLLQQGRRHHAHRRARRAARRATPTDYWERSESARFRGRPEARPAGAGGAVPRARALGGATSSACDVRVQVEREIDEDQWVWHVGPGRAGQQRC